MPRIAFLPLLLFTALYAQTHDPAGLTRVPTVYVTGYAHLDTQWRWDYQQTIREYLPKTLHENFELFEKYPHYVFNFSGANRYKMIQEYYPADYARMKRYIAAGRWFPAGSSMEEGEVLASSSESILRQILYGNHFFRREFGKASNEYLLPDSFGFPASLPSVLAHAGLRGFSTQKLGGMWNSASGIPFNIGMWLGPDGRGVIAALNAGGYNSQVVEDLSRNAELLKRARNNGGKSGIFADFRYYGVGDTGGSPRESSVKFVETSATGDGPLRVLSAPANRMFDDITPSMAARLEQYKGDLLLVEHSAGSLTSQAFMKQINRRNELLAASAETASLAARFLGALPYPHQRLNEAWRLVLAGQFHDILPGTASPRAYEFSWNDEFLAANQFSGVIDSAVAAVARGLDTRTEGHAVVVYNPLAIEREDIVEARVAIAAGAVKVTAPGGNEVPAQVLRHDEGAIVIAFLAKAPPAGFAVYSVEAAPASAPTALRVSANSLENSRYKIELNAAGDIAVVYDKILNRHLLSAPLRLAFQTHHPRSFPAWNMDWEDQQKPPRSFVEGPASIRIAENGPARVALEITREAEGSRFVQTVRLAAGDAGNRIEFAGAVDWKTKAAALKAVFPLAASNSEASYNEEPGVVRRANNDPRKYEVPAHAWLDLTDRSGQFGVTVLTGPKYGSDKPADDTVRLTLIYTPGAERMFTDQATQDWGHHEFVYGFAAHAGSAAESGHAARLDQPLVARETTSHAGPLGKAFSLLDVSNMNVRVMALKQAEDSEEIVVRLVETAGGRQSGVQVKFVATILAAREIDGQERTLAARAPLAKGTLVTDLDAFSIRSFAVKLAAPAARVPPVKFQAIALPPGGAANEPLPSTVAWSGLEFRISNLAARGQSIDIPTGFSTAYVLASATEDLTGTFQAGNVSNTIAIQSGAGFIGQWDNRIWKPVTQNAAPPQMPRGARPPGAGAPSVSDGFSSGFGAPNGPGAAPGPGAPRPPGGGMAGMMAPVGEYAGLTPAYLKPAPVAWFATHHRNASGVDEPYAYAYLYALRVPLPDGASTLRLPNNEAIRIFAITVANEK